MPELPEVQTTVSKLDTALPGLVIKDVWSDYFSSVYNGKQQIKNKKYFEYFKKNIIGAEIQNVTRRAKNILINLSNKQTILIHMKMTGHLLYGKYKKVKSKNPDISPNMVKWQKESWIPEESDQSPLWDPYNRFIHLVFSLSNGNHLALSDVRKFAKVSVLDLEKPKANSGLESIGPEPLEKSFTFSVFKTIVQKKSRGKIKQILMDQRMIAGIGNIYSDEILWSAGVHPESLAYKISNKKIHEIFKTLKTTLKKGISLGGDSMSDYRTPDGRKGSFQHHHNAYRKTGLQCGKKNCTGIIQRKKIGGRSAHFCNKHQN